MPPPEHSFPAGAPPGPVTVQLPDDLAHWLLGPDELFIAGAFMWVLGRAADAPAHRSYSRARERRLSRPGLLADLHRSDEARRRSIDAAKSAGVGTPACDLWPRRHHPARWRLTPSADWAQLPVLSELSSSERPTHARRVPSSPMSGVPRPRKKDV